MKRLSRTWMDKTLRSLIETMGTVDLGLCRIEQDGAAPAARRELKEALLRTFDFGKDGRPSLSRPSDLIRALDVCSAGRIGLQIRQRNTAGPCYYLFRRTGPDEAPLILEDLYMSDVFPFDDPMLFPVWTSKGETRMLRMSDFRQPMIKAGLADGDDAIDGLLSELGAGPLGAAVHPDQLLARAVGRAFDLPNFLTAVELCYFLLCARFSLLKHFHGDRFHLFFTKVYRNESIGHLFSSPVLWSGHDFAAKRRQAKASFAELSSAFRAFLDSKVELTGGDDKRPLGPLVFANYVHLSALRDRIRGREISSEAENLEQNSRLICNRLMD